MKKKIILALTSIVTMVVACFALVACNDTQNTPASFLQKMDKSESVAIIMDMGDGTEEDKLIMALSGDTMYADICTGKVRELVVVGDNGADVYLSILGVWQYQYVSAEEVAKQLGGFSMDKCILAMREVIKGGVNGMAVLMEDMTQKDGCWYLNTENGGRISIQDDIMNMDAKDGDGYSSIMQINLDYEIVIPDEALQAKKDYQKS